MSETYTRRRSQVLAGMNPGELLILYSGEAVPCSMDESYPFESNHHFYYLTGLRRENMALVLVKTESEEKEALFIEQPLPKLERWTGKRVTLEEARERSGIREVAFIGALQAYVERQLVRGGVTGLVMDCHKEALRAPDSYNLARAREWTGAFPALALRAPSCLSFACRQPGSRRHGLCASSVAPQRGGRRSKGEAPGTQHGA